MLASLHRRPVLGSATVCLLTCFYLLAVLNKTFWLRTTGYFHGNSTTTLLFAIGIFAACLALLIVPSAKYVTKPFLIFMLLSGSAAAWFTDQFGVIVDREMIRNAMVSTSAEAGHLLTLRFLLHMALTGILPALVLVWIRIDHRPILGKLLHNTVAVLGCLALLAVAGFSDYKTFAGIGRTHPDMLDTLTPFYPIASAVRFGLEATRDRNRPLQPLGTDARRTTPLASGKPRVTVIVAGETARADDFSLGGYDRDTNPELRQRQVAYFSDTTSCGTATAVSIPCMFSVYPRRAYSHRKGVETENLLDVLRHAGIAVTWLDNDTGAYRVADRVAYDFLPKAKDPKFCRDGECLDGVLLDRLDGWLDGIKGDSLLVLHQLGSHGPAYFERYPDAFRRFQPDCRAEDFSKCSPEEIRNAYDNTILYTDHIVSAVIDRLEARADRLSGAVVYLSDHGESLGENGIYLHGAPYILAPRQQTHVPFLVWISQALQTGAGFDMQCVRKEAGMPISHDNLFHSTLGLMDVATSAYDASLDIFAGCRRQTQTSDRNASTSGRATAEQADLAAADRRLFGGLDQR